jgi:mitochondrial chaperone BCS1
MRPGRIDKRIEYSLASPSQAATMFEKFFPTLRLNSASSFGEKGQALLDAEPSTLAEDFGSRVPLNEFSTAELQGYLLSRKKDPAGASSEITSWVEHERKERRERKEREERRKLKLREAREKYGTYGYPPFIPSAISVGSVTSNSSSEDTDANDKDSGKTVISTLESSSKE